MNLNDLYKRLSDFAEDIEKRLEEFGRKIDERLGESPHGEAEQSTSGKSLPLAASTRVARSVIAASTVFSSNSSSAD